MKPSSWLLIVLTALIPVFISVSYTGLLWAIDANKNADNAHHRIDVHEADQKGKLELINERLRLIHEDVKAIKETNQ